MVLVIVGRPARWSVAAVDLSRPPAPRAFGDFGGTGTRKISTIDYHDRMREWTIDEQDLEGIALGAAILGTGGGGNVYLGRLRAREQIRAGRQIRVVDPDDLADDDLIVSVGGIGAPTVSFEKIRRGDEGLRALRGIETVVGRKAAAVMSDEIGGSNAIEPLICAAMAGLPVVDGDGMGRAFPEMQMTTFSIYGVEGFPAVLCDDKGNTVVIQEAISPLWLERLARTATIAMGCTAVLALPPMSGKQVKAVGVKRTLSKAWRLGHAVLEARAQKRDPVAAILDAERGRLLFRGKIVDLKRYLTAGFARGHLEIEGFAEDAGATMRIEFQNENLVARVDGAVVATVPDLICIVDTDSGRPISTEELRYGLRITVLGLPVPPLLRTPEALAVVGPAAFGYDVAYQPLGEYVEPLGVGSDRG